MGKLAGLFLLLIMQQVAFGNPAYPNLPVPSPTDCGFYLKLEDELRCFNDAPYLTHYGYVYCNRFQKELKNWRGKLVSWVPQTTECLQTSLISDPSFLTPCQKMKKHAFATHPTCYKDSGFCDLAYLEKQRVLNIVSWADVIAEFGESVAQSLEILKDCDMSRFTAFFHFVDFIFQITRPLDALTRQDAAEIIANVPDDKKQAQNYMNKMYAAILYGSKEPSKAEISAVAAYKSTSKLSNLKNTIEHCEKSKSNFCDKLRIQNSILFSKDANQTNQPTQFLRNNLPERLKAARKLIENPQSN